MKEYLRHTIEPFDNGPEYRSFCALLIRHEIVYDINMMAASIAKIKFADADASLKKDIVLSAKQEDWLDRQIETAISKVKSNIRFAVTRHSVMSSNEILEHPHQYSIAFKFEKEWTEEPETLCDAIHTYVVKKCLTDWSMTACPDMLAVFKQQEEDALTDIHDIACSFTYDIINPIL